MGFAANQARLFALISRRSDLELDAQFLQQHRMYLGNMVSGYLNNYAKLEPGSQAATMVDARIKQLQQADKMLEMHINRINSQREAVVKEIDSVDKVLKDNIQKSFGIMGK